MIPQTCLVCDGTNPRHWDIATDMPVWLRFSVPEGYVTPFCSRSCLAAFEAWPAEQQRLALFSRSGLGLDLLRDLDVGRIVRDTPAPGDPLWVLDFGTIKYRNTLANDRTGLRGAVCPNPTEKSFSGLDQPDCCPDCVFLQPMGWREVVAR